MILHSYKDLQDCLIWLQDYCKKCPVSMTSKPFSTLECAFVRRGSKVIFISLLSTESQQFATSVYIRFIAIVLKNIMYYYVLSF